MVDSSGWAWSGCALLLGLVASTTATNQPILLSDALVLNEQLRDTQHSMLDQYHVIQDERTHAKDTNTQLHYTYRNYQNLLQATNNAMVHYKDVQLRHAGRNEAVYTWNVALNQSVQQNERTIKAVNQTNSELRDVSEAVDYHNVALQLEIGRWRDGREPATFSKTLDLAESVYKKISEHVTWTKVEAIAEAHRQQKEIFAVKSHHKKGLKQDLEVKASKLEAQVPTLMLQKNIQQTLKLSETWKKTAEKTRRDLYASKVAALQSSEENLLAKLLRLYIDSVKLRKDVSHLLMQRAALKQDVAIQNQKEINALLEKNAAEESLAKYKSLFEEAETTRKNALHAHAQHRAYDQEYESTKCQNKVRELNKDIAYLSTQNSLLDEHCTGLA